eukprot:CAMPEP_0201625952 /NCGR_PEP_ID=MMETSP0493-20130528/1547_1 /ASSEMBLY_ACC=CAM_ASM_000838 /TAXON_ID=420259 /ORGANISM="Thalassiosira gravida, Strain GMp14c1" /LENGTH=239 /DNA_ID=CAMNT_0048095999 /DNA_START=52 /DNA_END=769 /DNA_ORIENTATION=-
MVSKTLSTLSFSVLCALKCSAFMPHTHRSLINRSTNCSNKNYHAVLLAVKGNGGELDSILSSLPSPEAVKMNMVEGKVGERGEQYVVAQFGLLLLIAIGGVPFVGDDMSSFLGLSLIFAGLLSVYKAATDLKSNLSPWPVPADPKSGRGSLVDEGIYSYIRHPMYSGVLFGMIGLSLVTDSVTRLLLTGALYFVLDAKSNYEEEKMIDAYGLEYEDYQMRVQGKFLPPGVNDIFAKRNE